MKIDDIMVIEGKTPNIFIEIINSEFFKNCILPYLPESAILTDGHIKNIPLLYHGGKLKAKTKIYNIRLRKTSTDTLTLQHNVTNHLSNEKFGYPLRNLFFTSMDYEHAENYGPVSIVIPLDDYKLFYSEEYVDMFTEHSFSIKELIYRYKEETKVVLDSKGVRDNIKKIEELVGHESKTGKNLYEYIYRNLIGDLTHIEGSNRPLHIIRNKSVNTLDDIRSLYNSNTAKEVRDTILVGIYEYTDQLDNFNEILEVLNDVAKVVTQTLVKTAVSFVTESANEYLSTIVSTTDTAPIPSPREIMCTPGKYAVLKVDDLDDEHPIVRLQKIYNRL